MKYKDPKTGWSVDDIIDWAEAEWCLGRACSRCKLSSENNPTGEYCDIYILEHPEEAARYFGLKPVPGEKPLSEWTLGEVKAYCRSLETSCGSCPFLDKADPSQCVLAVQGQGRSDPRCWNLSGRQGGK